MKAALAEAQEFINQPEVRTMFDDYTARRRQQTRVQAPLHSQEREECKAGFTMGR